MRSDTATRETCDRSDVVLAAWGDYLDGDFIVIKGAPLLERIIATGASIPVVTAVFAVVDLDAGLALEEELSS